MEPPANTNTSWAQGGVGMENRQGTNKPWGTRGLVQPFQVCTGDQEKGV